MLISWLPTRLVSTASLLLLAAAPSLFSPQTAAPAGTAPVLLGSSLSQTVNNFVTPPVVFLGGSDLSSVVKVVVAGTEITPGSVLATTVRFRLPSGLPIGPTTIHVEDANGVESNPIPLVLDGTHPSSLFGPGFHSRNSTAHYRLWTEANWNAIYFVSASDAPSAIPNLVSLSIGNNFTQLIQAGFVKAGPNGDASMDLMVPSSGLPGNVASCWQAVTFPDNAVGQLEVSNSIFVYFPPF